jgi:tetratricopeptide (TPR) repeat protein
LSDLDDYKKMVKEWEAAGILEAARSKITHNVLQSKESLTNRISEFVSHLLEKIRNKAQSQIVDISNFISRHAKLTGVVAVCVLVPVSNAAFARLAPDAYKKTTEAISKVADKVVSTVASITKTDYSQKTGQALIARGNALRVKKQYAEAEDAYQGAIGKFTIKEDHRGLGNAYVELGILRTRTKDYKSAQRELHKGISYFDLVEDSNGLGYSHVNLAQLHLIRSHFKSARQHFLRAQQHYEASSNHEGLGNVSLGLGNLFVAKKDYPQATKHFEEAESKFQLVGNKRGLVSVYNSLAHAFEVLRTKRDKEEAAQYRQLAKAIELDTHSTTLPKFSIQESLSWLTSAFDQHRDVYESALNSKAKEETERVVR